MPLRRALLRAVLLAAALTPALAANALAAGTLAQLQGQLGCVTVSGSGGDCAFAPTINGPIAVVVSPDGRHVYVGAFDATSITPLARDPATGALSEVAGGCVSDTGGGGCEDGYGFSSVNDIAISPDGRNVYAASFFGSSVTAFARNAETGHLDQLPPGDGCVGAGGGGCEAGRGLGGARGVTVSPDGRFVYVGASASDSIATFARDQATGELTQLGGEDGCIVETPGGATATCRDGHGLDDANNAGISPDGRTLYAPAFVSDSVAILDRNLETGALTQDPGPAGCVARTAGPGCTVAKRLDAPSAALVSPDGRHVYVGGGFPNAIAVFARNTDNGDIQQLADPDGCIEETGNDVTCRDGVALENTQNIAFSPSGRTLYSSSRDSDAVAILDRNTDSGALSQAARPAGCVSETGSAGNCIDGRVVDGASDVAVSPAGDSVYVAGNDLDGIAVFQRGARPGCADATAAAQYESPVAVKLPCADPNGDPLALEVVGAPTAGTLGAVDQAAGAVTYTPPPRFFGTATFSYRAVAEDGASNVATATVSVAGPVGACRFPIDGTAAAETLDGTPFGDLVNGLAGNDRLEGGLGDDCLNGGAGRDKGYGRAGNDVIAGGADDDKLSGHEGNDTVSGNSGNDAVSGGDGNDKLKGGSGNDKLSGGKGKNSYSAGSGNDAVSAANGKKEKVDCGSGKRDRVTADRKDKLKGCERVKRKG